MWLVYDPAKFEKDLRYLTGTHKRDILAFIQTKFAKNAKSIEVKKLDLSKLYINNQSNIYSNKVEYDLSFDDYPYLENRKWELFKLEKYKNFNKQALLWTYIDKYGNIGFKALHASEFLISRKLISFIPNPSSELLFNKFNFKNLVSDSESLIKLKSL